MGIETILPGMQWNLSFGTGAASTFADALLFYAVDLLLLTYLGFGVCGFALSGTLQQARGTLTPFFGFALFVATYSILSTIGTDVTTTLWVVLAACTLLNGWRMLEDRRLDVEFSVLLKGWLLISVLALPCYAGSAVIMAHSGSLAYVGPQRDLDFLVPLTEWLKTHPAPLFSSQVPGLDPYWYASMPPRGGWLDPGAHLGDLELKYHDVLFLFQRGPRSVDAAMGLILGWDSYLLLRPSLAFMLSLSLPATYLFSRRLIGANTLTSVLAAAFMGLNGSLYYWITYGHAGQAVWTFLLPVALLVAVVAVRLQTWAPIVGAALLLAALPTSYYQATPLLAVALPMALAYPVLRSTTPSRTAFRTVVMGTLAIAIGLAEHLKFLLVVRDGHWAQAPTGKDPAGLGDGLGTTLHPFAFQPVAGAGQLSELQLRGLSALTALATALAIWLVVVGLWRGRSHGISVLRLLVVGAVLFMLALRACGYEYGYTKAQAMTTFLFSVAMAGGTVGLYRWILGWTQDRTFSHALGACRIVTAFALGIVAVTVSLNLAISAYGFWKPVGNIWNPKTWEISSLQPMLPPKSTVVVSPNILANPETILTAIHFLRNQIVAGDLIIKQPLAKDELYSQDLSTSDTTFPLTHLLGSSEIAAISGFTAADRIWSSSLLQAYRTPVTLNKAGDPFISSVRTGPELPIRIPTTGEATPSASLDIPAPGGSNTGQLLLVFAADAKTTVNVSVGGKQKLLSLPKGLAVRAVEAESPKTAILSANGPRSPWLLSLTMRSGASAVIPDEDYPNALAAVGSSTLTRQSVITKFTYFDSGMPASHSLDIYDAKDHSHPGWFELPTYPNGLVEDVEFTLDFPALTCKSALDGNPTDRRSSVWPLSDGEYVAYFSVWADSKVVKSIPLYRFTLQSGQLAAFESFRLAAAWNGQDFASR